MLTNYATNDIRERCVRLGADAVFDKSHELDALFEFCLALGPEGNGEPPGSNSSFSRLN